MMDALLLASARVLPVVLLAPVPATSLVRLALGLVMAGWLASLGAVGTSLTTIALLSELGFGLLLGTVLLFAGELARSAGILVQRPFAAESFDHLFGAVFWLVFLAGPHVIWLRGVMTPAPWLAGSDDFVRAFANLMAAIVETTLPVLVAYAVVHALQKMVESAVSARTLRASAEPLVLAVVLLLGGHAVTAHLTSFVEQSVEVVDARP